MPRRQKAKLICVNKVGGNLAEASHLVHMFIKNFSAFEAHVDHSVREAAPSMKAAAAE